MKKIFNGILFLVVLSSFNFNYAQDSIDKKILDESCSCIKKIKYNIEKASKIDSINSCITQSIINSQSEKLIKDLSKMMDTLKWNKKDTTYVSGKNLEIIADKDFDKIQKKLFLDCPNVKELMMSNDKESENSISNKKKAKEYYHEGQKYDLNEQYDLAIVQYNKAVKSDPDFAFAWDNMGLCYRKLNRYEEAIKCYKKSLEADPKGTMPLQNMAVAYDYLKDYKSASETYLKIIKNSPEDAEGYYGAGSAFFSNQDYENGLDYMFQAYILYKNTNSPYIHDSETLIGNYYNFLKEKNQIDLFNKVAKKYNIQIE
ncbi:tetratricopeptide repeat protein [Flavobacterium sp. 103]|uniref:tetratricopeptide repeat protein n=1 Tax=Flavobacterium sp. 103 TaxID=2135624 RepID=UPI000D5E4915|nr:tetratricopeptide repeat protein [Flavobacterium sp. 103]PVX45928.1 tetratricopeptide repeat protein [Flavobacterium sp. 103]